MVPFLAGFFVDVNKRMARDNVPIKRYGGRFKKEGGSILF